MSGIDVLDKLQKRVAELETLVCDTYLAWERSEVNYAVQRGSTDARTPELCDMYKRIVDAGIEVKQ